MSIESGQFESEPEKLLPDNAEEVKIEAEKLVKKQTKKTYAESIVSEYQTRKAKVRGTDIERGAAFRFERGQIYKGYMNLRKEIRRAEKRGEDTTSKKDLLKAIREKAKVVERDLDELNRQYHENVRNVDIETKFGNFTFPIVELDLKKDKEGRGINPEEDKRIPDFFLGGLATNYHQTACFTMARALEGHKIYSIMQPEQPSVKKPDNFKEIIKNQGNLKPYSELVKKVIEKIGLEEFNLSGFSMGATIALELAADPELQGLHNLTVMEPLGFTDKGLVGLAEEFGIGQLLKRTLPSSEERIKGFAQGAEAGQGDALLGLEATKILAKKHFDAEKLATLHPMGRFQVWMGDKDPIINERVMEKMLKDAEVLKKEKNPEYSQLEIYKIQGADHFLPMMNSLGLSRMIDGEKPQEQVTTINEKELGHSAAEWILKDIKE